MGRRTSWPTARSQGELGRYRPPTLAIGQGGRAGGAAESQYRWAALRDEGHAHASSPRVHHTEAKKGRASVPAGEPNIFDRPTTGPGYVRVASRAHRPPRLPDPKLARPSGPDQTTSGLPSEAPAEPDLHRAEPHSTKVPRCRCSLTSPWSISLATRRSLCGLCKGIDHSGRTSVPANGATGGRDHRGQPQGVLSARTGRNPMKPVTYRPRPEEERPRRRKGRHSARRRASSRGSGPTRRGLHDNLNTADYQLPDRPAAALGGITRG